jgi:FkbM family methyltransferase
VNFRPLLLDTPKRLPRFELRREARVDIPELGLSYIVPTRSLIGRLLRQNGMYEEHVVNWITERFTPDSGGLFVDVGANFGWYSCLFAKIADRVILYEPDPANASLLERNLKLNDAANYTLQRAAVGSRKTTGTLHKAHKSNPGAHTLVGGAYSSGQLTVPVVTLDETVPAGPISLMKIDIEGFELEALRGGREVLSRTKVLVIEFSPDFLRRGGYNPSELWGMFREFDAVRVDYANGAVRIADEPKETCDLILVRR